MITQTQKLRKTTYLEILFIIFVQQFELKLCHFPVLVVYLLCSSIERTILSFSMISGNSVR